MKRFTNVLLAVVLILTLVLGTACETLSNHTHTPKSTTWEYDETGHWHVCSFEGCTEKVDFAAHSGGTATYKDKAKCAVCGTKYGDVTAHECDWVETTRTVSCVRDGSISYKCSLCSKTKTDQVKKYGHKYEEMTDYSRMQLCTNPGCKAAIFPESNSDFHSKAEYTFNSADRERVDATYDQLVATLEGYGDYDATLHGYDVASEWYTKNAAFEDAFYAFEDEIYFVIAQYQFAKIQSDIDFKNQDKQNAQLEISNYYDEVLAYYNSLFPLVYETPLREYFFYGMTQEEIDELLEETRNASDPEWVRLSNRNNEIETEYEAITNISGDARVLELYAEFVANNNAMAQIKGYDNYMDYAYENIYGREYTPDQMETYYQYLVQYIAPLATKYETAWKNNQNKHSGGKQYDNFVSFVSDSFFINPTVNKAVNDFLEVIETTDSQGNTVSYYEIFNDLMETENYFRGTYDGAYSWYIRSLETPILFFGNGSDGANTVIHEFGHYANELKNYDNPQSFDLSETHSQGLEVLFMSWLNEHKTGLVTQTVYDLYSSYTLLNNLWITCIAAGVDAFERAVYSNNYTGASAESIMADGQITGDEYDTIFAEIMAELGLSGYNDYWRKVVVRSAGYYISYSVSMLCSLQLASDGTNFDQQVQAYLKLVNYSEIEEQIDFNYKQVLEYAGLMSYDDEDMFKYIAKVLAI